ncbi:Crp/Fnr family transcriptional regulator [Dyadobacter sp. MSC1_007]|jgi:CRP-like cAMP-binding protein|uniref:Crp/Fnr family transcriptional regulator n=1 Tax=Dyadobacter sp. MSC1_007 TaxID=2909264 RepID=UPI00202F2F06|nr:cyclic nucleotide-binding domain-containing protein [Dyadobacter sp. MSC1_007]
MNPFISYLNTFVELPDEVQRAINDITIHRRLPRGTTLLAHGDVCKEFHFLASGLVRVFYYKSDKDVTAWFAAEKAIASAIDSLFSGRPSMYNIELLEDSEIYSL